MASKPGPKLGTTECFVYGRSYLERSEAVPIDPVALKLRRRTYRTTALKGMFGSLRDASPDYRGRYAHAGNLLSQSARFHLKREEAESLIAEMEKRVAAGWYDTVRREGVSERDCETIKAAFVYPGFRLEPGGHRRDD